MDLSASGSVTEWIAQLRAGDRQAVHQLWERYFQRLVGVARGQLAGGRRRAADEEDVALSAFASLCHGVEQGHFPHLRDRDELWGLLVTIAQRKASALLRHERRQKRGGGMVRGDSALRGPGSDAGVLEPAGGGPTPEFAAEVADECRRLLGLLDDDEQRQIAVWKLEGYTNAEIAQQLGYVEVTVERRLRLIRGIWAREVPARPAPEGEPAGGQAAGPRGKGDGP
jgi:DNA-directed RNA polymerase specialized sigma24 family protein